MLLSSSVVVVVIALTLLSRLILELLFTLLAKATAEWQVRMGCTPSSVDNASSIIGADERELTDTSPNGRHNSNELWLIGSKVSEIVVALGGLLAFDWHLNR